MAILNLLLQQQDRQAVEALQLDMLLLPLAVKEEMHRLLKFMTAVSLDSSLVLDPLVSFVLCSFGCTSVHMHIHIYRHICSKTRTSLFICTTVHEHIYVHTVTLFWQWLT